MQYNKSPKSIAEQITLLESRGLEIPDKDKAALFLSNISYYRIRAYTYPFQDNINPDHPFKRKISFDQILDQYFFDRELRLMLFDAIEKIEIALRTQIIYQFCLKYGSHWFENPALFINADALRNDLNSLDREIKRSSERFIEHYFKKYTAGPLRPPAWMSFEVISMGTLSKFFENIRISSEKKDVVMHFGLKHADVLESWIRSFSHVRNIVAHHGRLWNQVLTRPKIPKNTIYPFLSNRKLDSGKIYVVLCEMAYILNIISPGNHFILNVKTLLAKYPNINPINMGFPDKWKEEDLWKNHPIS